MDQLVSDTVSGEGWTMYCGDSCEVIKGIPDDSIGFGIHSPPFSSLYIYSDSERDMGNCANDEEFFQHYRYLIDEMLRATIPGRLVAVHCKDLPRYANVYGTTGLIDFPGMCIQEYEDAGWVFHSRVTIWKCPVTERERTNNNGLLHKTVTRDSSQLRQGMADYLLLFRKPPIEGLLSAKPIVRPRGFGRYIGLQDPASSSDHPSKFAREPDSRRSVQIWQRYAEPVWWDVSQTRVLNYKLARNESDEKHICPLQLDVIGRAVHIWSDSGDVVFSPFAGIGSEGYESIRLGRKFIGIELKDSYFAAACNHLREAERKASEPTLFDGLEAVT